MRRTKCEKCGSENIYRKPVRHEVWIAVRRTTGCDILCKRCMKRAIRDVTNQPSLGDLVIAVAKKLFGWMKDF